MTPGITSSGSRAVRVGYILFGLMALCLIGCPERSPSSAVSEPTVVAPDAAAPAVAPALARARPPTAPADAAPPPTPPMIGQCAGALGDKPIMTPCTDHCACSTGYCYDEGFLGGGFCSMDCNAPSIGDCGKIRHPTQPHLQKYGCLQLIALAKAHELKTTRICVLRCGGVDECRAYDDRYDQCGNYSGGRATMWEGHTIAAFGACLDSTRISGDRP